jgi:transposase
MAERRLVGIDLGVSSKHTVVVLRGDGSLVGRRSCIPTQESLLEVEQAALRGATEGTRLEVVMEPTGPAWLPVVVFFEKRGHLVFRASSAQSADLRRFLSRHAKSNRIDADALARLPLFVDDLKPVRLPSGDQASLERRVRLCDRLVAEAGSRKSRIRALVRELLPMTPLADDLTKADLAILERTGGNPHRLLEMGRTRLVRLVKKTSHGHLGEGRAVVWMAAAEQSLELYEESPAIAFEDRADAVKTELALLKACETELAKHQLEREAGYRRLDPDQLMCSLPGVAEVGAPVLSVFLAQAARYPNGRHFVSYTGLVADSSETGDSDRKGQVMSKAGPGLLRTTLVRAANTARQQDPQLAQIYYRQMVERGATHQKALCVVAAHLAERAYRVASRGTPYQLRDLDGRPLTREQARLIATTTWRVPEEVRRRRRNKKTRKAPQQFPSGNASAHGATRRPSPSHILAAAASAGNPVLLRTDVST